MDHAKLTPCSWFCAAAADTTAR